MGGNGGKLWHSWGWLDTIRKPWTVSSVGRAPPLQGGGHWFEPSTVHYLSGITSASTLLEIVSNFSITFVVSVSSRCPYTSNVVVILP